MEFVRESNLYRLWLALCTLYGGSGLHRMLATAGWWCSRQIDDSAVLRVLCREGFVAKRWRESLTCHILTWLVNLPAAILHRIYRALKGPMDGSFFANLAFEMGAEAAVAESWLILLLWVIPFKYWNNAYNLLAFMLLLALLYLRGMRERDARLDVASVGFFPAVLLAAMCLAVPQSAYPDLSARYLLYHMICALCVLVTVSAVRNIDDLKRLCAGGGFVVLATSLYGVYQRIQGVEVSRSTVDLAVNAGMPGRVRSIFDNENTFAEVLILLLPLLVALILCSRRWWTKLAAAFAFAAGVAALGMTYSRASWVGFACAAVVFVFLWRPSLLPAFAVLCVLCIPLLPTTIWNRILTIGNMKDTSTASRIPLYQAALAVIRKSPLTGAGLGTDAVKEYIKTHGLYHARAPFIHAHNLYLEIWIEAGLLGVVSFVGAMLWNIKNAARRVRHCPDSPARTITAAAAAALCGAMVGGLADFSWHYPRVMCIYWFVFAAALAGTKLLRHAGT